MKENQDIDELLNGFIDGELSARQQTEVQRLIAHDEHVARRLQELQKCRMLVSSLPCAEAPAEITKRIEASLQEKTLSTERTAHLDRKAGVRHLLFRNVAAVAAMIGLVAALAAVVYTIIGPESATDRPAGLADWRRPIRKVEVSKLEVASAEKSIADAGAALPTADDGMRFNGRVELKTDSLVAVDAFINRAIEDNGLVDCADTEAQENKRIYALSCSREALSLLLADLQYVWARFDSATLFVGTEQIGNDVVVDEVTPEQVVEIANQNTLKSCIKVAKDFAVLNNMAGRFPGREILAAIDDGRKDLIAIPRPVLTSNEKAIEERTAQIETGEKVHLTIVVAGSE